MAASGHVQFRCLSATDKQGQYSASQVTGGFSVDTSSTNKCFQKQHPAHAISFFIKTFRNGGKKAVLLGFIKVA